MALPKKRKASALVATPDLAKTQRSPSKALKLGAKSPEVIVDSSTSGSESPSETDSDSGSSASERPKKNRDTGGTNAKAPHVAKKKETGLATVGRHAQVNGAPKKAAKPESLPDLSSGSENESNGGSESAQSTASSSDSDNATAHTVSKSSTQHPQKRKAQTVSAGIADEDFRPPPGFTAGLSLRPDPALESLLAEEALDGKQLWHISAPAKLSLARLETLSMAAIDTGQAIIKHGGTSYAPRLSQDKNSISETLIVPGADGYRAVTVPFNKAISLEQVLDEDPTNSEGAPVLSLVVAQRAYAKPLAPQQPTGLRMRYQPVGVVEEASNKRTEESREAHEGQLTSSALPQTAKNGDVSNERAKRKAEKAERARRRELKRLKKAAVT